MRVSLLELSPSSREAALTVSERGGARFGPGEDEEGEEEAGEEEDDFRSGACGFDAGED